MLNDREKILSALREKPLKVYEIMKRANVANEQVCQSLLLKMRDEGSVKFIKQCCRATVSASVSGHMDHVMAKKSARPLGVRGNGEAGTGAEPRTSAATGQGLIPGALKSRSFAAIQKGRGPAEGNPGLWQTPEQRPRAARQMLR
jgi:hypothetical protein